MTVRQRLTLWRRRWCIRRGHPIAPWSPVVFYQRGPNGEDIETKAWRCIRHDKEETE